MDRIKSIGERKRNNLKRFVWPLLSVTLVAVGFTFLVNTQGTAKAVYPQETRSFENRDMEVETNNIFVRARLAPSLTYYLDLIEGGIVAEVYVQEGEAVDYGQPLVRLRNSSLELEVISREAQITEQLNNLRNTRIMIEQDRLNIRREIVELNYELSLVESERERLSTLHDRGLVSDKEYKDISAEQKYLNLRLQIAEEREEQNDLLRSSQLVQMQESTKSLELNLSMARKNLDSLIITSSQVGFLSSFDVELGEYLARGQRIGQIDSLDSLKAVAYVDEFYLSQVQVGRNANSTIQGEEYKLTVEKIYPQVNNGRFQVDLIFDNYMPENLRRGQSIGVNLLTNNLIE